MNDKKFKIGDKVRITNTSSIESYELNKVGTIVGIKDYGEWFTYVVDMGRPRRPNKSCDNETCWYLRDSMIEFVYKSNQQLVFNFMLEKG